MYGEEAYAEVPYAGGGAGGGSVGLVVGRAVETDAAQSVTWESSAVVGRAVETDTAQSVTGVSSAVVGRAVEIDAALSVTWAIPRLATETDTALSVEALVRAPILAVAELDTAEPVEGLSVRGRGEELDTAQGVTPVLGRTVGPVVEEAVVLPLGSGYRVGPARETDTTRSIFTTKQIPTGIAIEVDEAQRPPLTTARVGVAEEWSYARHVSGGPEMKHSFGQITLAVYRYTPVSVNVGYEYGSVESHEYRRSAVNWEQRTTRAGVPIPVNDPRRP